MVVLLNPNPNLVSDTVGYIRDIEQTDRAIMIIWEEFERWVNENEGCLLDLLDGVEQVDNAFYIATTNYIEQIPSRIRNRPSRFAEVKEIGAPNAELRRAFLEAKIHPEDKVDIDDWVERTEGFTIDYIKDVIISVLVLGLSLEDATSKLQTLKAEDEYYAKEEKNQKTKLDNVFKLLKRQKRISHEDEPVEPDPEPIF